MKGPPPAAAPKVKPNAKTVPKAKAVPKVVPKAKLAPKALMKVAGKAAKAVKKPSLKKTK